VAETIGKAPEVIRLHARNPAHSFDLGDGSMAFCAVASAPNCSDLEGGRRTGNRADYQNLLRLAQSLNVIHVIGGYPVEPVDLHPGIRHLDALADMVRLTDKVFHAYSLGRERIVDALEIARIARGVDADTLAREPSLFSIINASSPLRFDAPMLRGMIDLARVGQVVVVTPFTLAGAMAPVTLAGALAQQNAEALAGLVLTQLVRPGAPFVYGGFTSNVDMKSGAPAFGTPEYMNAVLVGGQLARRYRVPYRTSNVNAANTVDAQASYESVFSLWATTMAGGDLIKHAAGWMEGGLCASFEKMVLDADLLQMVSAFLDPIEVSEATLALDAVREVGPGGHYFGAAHTQARYRDAFYAPLISDWRNHESWLEAGAPDAQQHAHDLVKALLADYQPPPLDPAIDEELEAFIARRKREGGVPTDF
jgi:trimethylamine--corrinoid protein Co-methyltransferase